MVCDLQEVQGARKTSASVCNRVKQGATQVRLHNGTELSHQAHTDKFFSFGRFIQFNSTSVSTAISLRALSFLQICTALSSTRTSNTCNDPAQFARPKYLQLIQSGYYIDRFKKKNQFRSARCSRCTRLL